MRTITTIYHDRTKTVYDYRCDGVNHIITGQLIDGKPISSKISFADAVNKLKPAEKQAISDTELEREKQIDINRRRQIEAGRLPRDIKKLFK